jgi:hypothetical protein
MENDCIRQNVSRSGVKTITKSLIVHVSIRLTEEVNRSSLPFISSDASPCESDSSGIRMSKCFCMSVH